MKFPTKRGGNSRARGTEYATRKRKFEAPGYSRGKDGRGPRGGLIAVGDEEELLELDATTELPVSKDVPRLAVLANVVRNEVAAMMVDHLLGQGGVENEDCATRTVARELERPAYR